MKHTYGKKARRAGLALAAVTAFTALGTGAAQAQEFTTADITINSVGFLDCAFKETGLTPGATVEYSCNATDVAWITQCFNRSKPIANIAPRLHVAHAADGLLTTQSRTATGRGTVTSAILTAYPTPPEPPEGEFEPVPLCPTVEGLVITEEITAIRWCNASLADVTNNVSGTSEPELFLQMKRNGASNIPDCATLAGMPSDF